MVNYFLCENRGPFVVESLLTENRVPGHQFPSYMLHSDTGKRLPVLSVSSSCLGPRIGDPKRYSLLHELLNWCNPKGNNTADIGRSPRRQAI